MHPALKLPAEIVGPRLDPEKEVADHDLARLAVRLLRLLRRYFRAEVHGLEHLPPGAALIVGNHNSGITMVEPFMLGLAWYERHQEFLYFLGHDVLVDLPWLGNLLIKLGVIRASHQAAGQALDQGKKIVVFPGGNYEAFRPFSQRHRVDFGPHLGYLKLALRARVPLVPMLSIGGHESLLVLARGQRLARFSGIKRSLRSDSFPLFLGLPWGVGLGPIFHLPLPAKLDVELGAPLDLSAYGPEAAEDRPTLERLHREVQGRLQQMMDRRAARRRWPLLG